MKESFHPWQPQGDGFGKGVYRAEPAAVAVGATYPGAAWPGVLNICSLARFFRGDKRKNVGEKVMAQWQGAFFWGFLIVFGLIMVLVSPRAKSEDSFFRGYDDKGRPSSPWMLTSSIFISWIFAKSVTNAANLGQSYGIVGGLAYAAYWLSIPMAGIVIYVLRTRYKAVGLVSFLTGRYGRVAALAFSAAILVRLYNEVWSNSAVVGGYYGADGSWPFILSASLFTLMVLLYSLKGGLRSSLFTDAIQTVLFILAIGLVLFLTLPAKNFGQLVTEGSFTLAGGVDLLLVALLQVFSYPFHDPVLTDRGFISHEKVMLKACCWSGALGFLAILAFSLIGVQARLEGLPPSGNVPAMVAQTLGFGASFAMLAVMASSAASTMDSTFASLSKFIGKDWTVLSGRDTMKRPILMGALAMIVLAVLGNIPMVAGTDILKATTISGTMVIGLAPVFLLSPLVRKCSPWSFHLSFWCGMYCGFGYALGWFPQSWALGDGKQALLLGVNLYGLLLCTAGFLLPLAARKLFGSAVPSTVKEHA